MNRISLPSLLTNIVSLLKNAQIDVQIGEQYAWWLLETLFSKNRLTLLTHNELIMTSEKQATLDKWLDQLITDKMPIQYIIGRVPFCDVDILIETPILIPRPETEEWVATLINQLRQLPNKNITILDMATGSGCIALALAKAFPYATIYATDISSTAIALAQKNKIHNNLNNVHFFISDLFNQLPSDIIYDLIVSNPPYIPLSMWSTLEPSVRLWEDKKALIAGDSGMDLIKKIIDITPSFLKPNTQMMQLTIPQLIIEIDCTHGAAATTYMQNRGFADVQVHKDYMAKNRVVSGRVAPLL